MTTKKETKKEVLINLRITEHMASYIKLFDINVSDTCREALLKEIDKQATIEVEKNKKSLSDPKMRGTTSKMDAMIAMTFATRKVR